MLVTVNILPLVLMYLLLARLVERFGTTDWGRVFVMAAATLGTLLTTFAVVLNNHLVAAVGAAVALYALVRICYDGERRSWYFALAGLAAAFTAANELPALSLLAAMGLLLLSVRRGKRCWRSLPAALVVVGGLLRHQLHRPRQPAAALHAPQRHRPDDNWYAYTYTVNGGSGRATGSTRRGSTAASRRGWCMRCTCWWATTASSRSRRSGC